MENYVNIIYTQKWVAHIFCKKISGNNQSETLLNLKTYNIVHIIEQTERNSPRNRLYRTVQGTDGTERFKEQTKRNGPRNRRNGTVQGTDGTKWSMEQT